MTKTTVAAMTLVLVAAPAAAASCKEDTTQDATYVAGGGIDGGWTSSNGPLARLQRDGSWEAATGSTVDTVGVRSGVVDSGEAAVSAAVLVPGGESGRLPALTDARTAIFHGTTSCDTAADSPPTIPARTAGAAPTAEETATPAPTSTTTITLRPTWTPPLYPTWRGRVR